MFDETVKRIHDDNQRNHQDSRRDWGAKMDNVERSLSEASANMKSLMDANTQFVDRITTYFDEEREDRRALMELMRGDSRESIQHAREKRNALEQDLKGALGTFWEAGGKYLFGAVVLYLVYLFGGGRSLIGFQQQPPPMLSPPIQYQQVPQYQPPVHRRAPTPDSSAQGEQKN